MNDVEDVATDKLAEIYIKIRDKRAETNLKQFLEENPNLLPAGLQADSKYTVVVRRSKA